MEKHSVDYQRFMPVFEVLAKLEMSSRRDEVFFC